MAKNYNPFGLLFPVSKIFAKLVHSRFLITSRNVAFFSNFQWDFKSSHSNVYSLTVAPDRIARVFDWSGVAKAIALAISKAFDRN